MLQDAQNAPAASEQSRLREKARLVRVWYNIDRKYGCSHARNLVLYIFLKDVAVAVNINWILK